MKKLLLIQTTILLLLTAGFTHAQDQPWWNSWVKYPTNSPVLEGDTGTWCENLGIDGPTVIYEEGIFKIWFVGGDRGEMKIGFAWSEDGVNWNMKKEPVVFEGTGDWTVDNMTGQVLRINDTLRMWYYSGDGSTFTGIGYAWSVDDTLWHGRPEPVLAAGEPGTWDEGVPFWNKIYYDSVKYHMYYAGGTNISHFNETGHAISYDGINWERDTANPVIRLGPEGSFYDHRILPGPLVKRNDTLHMFFTGYDEHNGTHHPMVGYAYSTDSPDWSEWTVGNNEMPVLQVGASGSWDEHYSDYASVLYHDGLFHMWYRGIDDDLNNKIGYARQSLSCLPEGIAFTRQTQIDSFQISCPNCNVIEGDVTIPEGSVTHVNRLNILTCIGGNLSIENNTKLRNLSGLKNITSIGGFLSIENSELPNLDGLENLASIGGNLSIVGNNSLSDLIDSDKLVSVGGYLAICENHGLNSLIGLENLNTIGGDLVIIYNSFLSSCDIASICNYLSAPTGNITINNNGSGCNSREEVEEACNPIISIGIYSDPGLSIYPNPFNNRLTIDFPDKLSLAYSIELFDMSGRLVYLKSHQPVTAPCMLNLSILESGIYLLRISNVDYTVTETVIKVE